MMFCSVMLVNQLPGKRKKEKKKEKKNLVYSIC